MAEPYLTNLRNLLVDVLRDLGTNVEPEFRHFFSGAAAYVGGRIFMTLTPSGLALKLSPDSRQRLMHEGGQPLRYFSNGPIKKDYGVFPDDMRNDIARLLPWVSESIEYVSTLPPPRPRKPKKRSA